MSVCQELKSPRVVLLYRFSNEDNIWKLLLFTITEDRCQKCLSPFHQMLFMLLYELIVLSMLCYRHPLYNIILRYLCVLIVLYVSISFLTFMLVSLVNKCDIYFSIQCIIDNNIFLMCDFI